MGRGIEFFGVQNGFVDDFSLNSMAGNVRGFTLNNAAIGAQGWPGLPTGNEWVTNYPAYPPYNSSPTLWWNLSLGHSQTYVTNNNSSLNAPASVIYVFNSGLNYIPTYHFSAPATAKYVNGSSILTTYQNPSLVLGCISGGGGSTPSSSIYPKPLTSTALGSLESAATASLYGTSEPVNSWITQLALYQYLLSDTAIVDSSTILQEFMTLAASSRFAYLNHIEGLLADGHYGAAQCQLNNTSLQVATGYTLGTTGAVATDSSAADTIVQNYVQFFKIYKHFMQGVMSGADSTTTDSIAHLCPNTNGAVVYKARALYTMLYDDPRVWDDEMACGYSSIDTGGGSGGDSTGGRKVRPVSIKTDSVQKYSLYPNPTNGNITLVQHLIDENPVQIELLNAEGQSVLKRELFFNAGLKQINLQNLQPGLYLVVLRDMKGQSYTLKFIVN
jgi:hypothetical protein